MLNKTILMGRLTKDPEFKMTPSGVSVVNFTIAVDRDYQRQGEERQTDFINCVAFRNTADFISKYFVKGQLMCVCGSIQIRTWEGQDGKKGYATEVIVNEAHFTGDKRNEAPKNTQQTAPSQGEFIRVEDNDLPF